MTKNKTFSRKIAYLCAIAVLFVPLSLVSAPAPRPDSGGGVLSQMRREENLSQAQLGKIDPASATMSLATLGLQGVATNLLWGSAHHYKKTENWDAFMATLNQIAKLQPNFASVWVFQSWNVSYNVSVEFDDYRDRYHWVKRGVDYLIEGNEYNRDDPQLLWEAGWFFGHKMGRSDEHQQFRRLFRDDEDFHRGLPLDFDLPENQGPDGKPDNWKVAHSWFDRAERVVDRGGRIRTLSLGYWAGTERVIGKRETPLKGKNPLVFHSDPPKALINYAAAIGEDGYLDEVGQLAWRDAGRAWEAYGDRPIVSSFGTKIRLNDRERNQRELEEAATRLAQLAPDVEVELTAQRRASLTPEEVSALETPDQQRSEQQFEIAAQAEQKLEVSLLDIANAAPAEVRDEARRWARAATEAAEQVRIIDRYRSIVNFVYWGKRCEAEQWDTTIEARKRVLQADAAFADARLEEAREQYELAWQLWGQVFDKYPELVDDVEGEIIYEAVERYARLMGQLEETFPPENFPLMMLVEQYGNQDVPLTVEAPAE